MLWLAFRMLFQERGRLVITLVGIVFSTVLTLVEVGIYLGKREIKPNNPAVNLGLKIIQVKIALLETTPLKLGMTMDVRISPADK